MYDFFTALFTELHSGSGGGVGGAGFGLKILKTASALNRKQYSHFYSFEEACAYFDRERELIFRRAIGICSFYDVDCEDITR
jgi:hypothetical protein